MSVLVAAAFCVVPPPATELPGPVTRGFVAPACQRCAGHRGVTVGFTGSVRALLPGVVTFDGAVGGRRFLVMRVDRDIRLTYGDLSGPLWQVGQVIATGAPLGTADGVLYLGVRRGGAAVDPALLFRRSGPRLVAPLRLVCPARPPWLAQLPR